MADPDSEPDPLPDRGAGPDDAAPKHGASASADSTTGSARSNADGGHSTADAGRGGHDAAGHSAAEPLAERDSQPEFQAGQQDDPKITQQEVAVQQQTIRDATEKRRADRPTESQLTGAVFNFNAAVTSTGGIGAQGGQPMDAVRRRATGRLADDDVTATISRYARPDCFDETVELLRQDRVVVIEGKSGTGRRAGAISLLRAVTAGRLVVLSPLVTLSELAERKYKEGLGYLVVDRLPDGNSADLDFTWAALRDQVRDGKAYLVVTSAAVAVRAANRAVRHVIWDRPSAGAVLKAQLVGRGYLRDVVDGTVARLVAQRCFMAVPPAPTTP